MRPVGLVSSPMPDGNNERFQRCYSLRQDQLVGNEKRRTGCLQTERRSEVTWGSPTRGDAQGDGAVIVIAGVTTRPGAWESHVQGEVPQGLVLDSEVGLDGPEDFEGKEQRVLES
jgi:hypothetical protein